jgi:hypothetical protein
MSGGTPAPAPTGPVMWNRLNVKLITSAGTLAVLVAVLEAGRKWV